MMDETNVLCEELFLWPSFYEKDYFLDDICRMKLNLNCDDSFKPLGTYFEVLETILDSPELKIDF